MPMTDAEHYADLLNNVYGAAVTLNWGCDDLMARLPAGTQEHWDGSMHRLTFADGSKAEARYTRDGVKLYPAPPGGQR